MSSSIEQNQISVALWASCANALYTFKCAFTVVVSRLGRKARMLSILRFDFTITLVTIEDVLQNLLLLAFLQLQANYNNVTTNEAVTLISQLQQKKSRGVE